MASMFSSVATHQDRMTPEIPMKPEMSLEGRSGLSLAHGGLHRMWKPSDLRVMVNEMVSLLDPQYKEDRGIVGRKPAIVHDAILRVAQKKAKSHISDIVAPQHDPGEAHDEGP